MTPPNPDPVTKLEQRVKQLEERLAQEHSGPEPTPQYQKYYSGAALILAMFALICGYLGLGLPQHYYQPLFAGLVLLLGYDRRFWRLQPGSWRWPLVILNFCVLTLLFKLLIGAGMDYPFEWLKVPTIDTVPPPHDSPWLDRLIPEFVFEWRAIPEVTDWNFDMTQMQTFLLIATLAGALFRFQPFASLTALALLLVSIPTFMNFNWDWVILFLIVGSASFYLQSRKFLP